MIRTAADSVISAVLVLTMLLLTGQAFSQTNGKHDRNEESAQAQIDDLKKQVEELQRRLDEQDNENNGEEVDLSGEEIREIQSQEPLHVLAKPWYHNIKVSGFGAAGFLDSGRDGTRPNGGFLVKESSIFIEAEAWENMSFFLELHTNFVLFDDRFPVRTGEVYVHFKNVLSRWGNDLLGIKAGRVDIPFGEEYLWNDSPDNLMISHTAAYPWLWDEGVVLYGRIRGLGWVASITDGSMNRSVEDDPAKALTAKIYGTPVSPLYLSGSVMRNGKTSMTAIYVGGTCLHPIGSQEGAKGFSTLGASPSQVVDATLHEGTAKIRFSRQFDLELMAGRAFIDDDVDAFDRTLSWFSVQPRLNLSNNVYLIARHSEIGTYDGGEGYMIGGEFLAGGKEAFGHDAKRLQRSAIGIGWKPNPRATIKFEIGRDRYEVIDDSPINAGDDKRGFVGAEVVLKI